MIRAQYSSPTLDKWAVFLSELGDKYALGVVMLFTGCLVTQDKAFIMTIVMTMAHCFSCLVKSVYQEPRPFFVADLVPSQCRFEYGNPSGHSFVAVGMYLTLWDFFFRTYCVERKLLQRVTLGLTVVLILAIGASRIYNGVHTYNQVI